MILSKPGTIGSQTCETGVSAGKFGGDIDVLLISVQFKEDLHQIQQKMRIGSLLEVLKKPKQKLSKSTAFQGNKFNYFKTKTSSIPGSPLDCFPFLQWVGLTLKIQTSKHSSQTLF